MHRAAVAEGDQARQQAAVVDMRVRQHHRIERLGVEGERAAVAAGFFPAALMHAAFEQNPCTIMGLNEIAGAGDLLNGA